MDLLSNEQGSKVFINNSVHSLINRGAIVKNLEYLVLAEHNKNITTPVDT